MDLQQIKQKRQEIKQEHFATGSLVILSILGLVGLLLFLLSGILSVNNYDSLYDCVATNGMMMIFGLFFFIISLYCWYGYITNIIIPPKKTILYLLEKDEEQSKFIDKRGKKYLIENCTKIEKKYYYVIKTRDYIYEVLNECHENIEGWSLKEKPNYWLNWYSPMGNFKDIMLLPIIYVLAAPGILSTLMSKGIDRIWGLILSAVPLLMIIYDLIIKIKVNKSEDGYVDEYKIANIFNDIVSFVPIIILTIVCSILTILFFKVESNIEKLIYSPFLLCALISLGATVSKLIDKPKLVDIFYKGYILIFLAFWFGFLTFFTIGIVKQEGNIFVSLYTIPFWTAGIVILYKFFFKKNK